MPAKMSVINEDAIKKIRDVEIVIPDTCPNCGTDLTQPNAVQENGWVFYCSHGGIQKAAPDHGRLTDNLECDGSFEECFDAGTMHTEYLCNACDCSLVSLPRARKRAVKKTATELVQQALSLLYQAKVLPVIAGDEAHVLGRLADDACEAAAVIRSVTDRALGLSKRPGTLVRQVRRALGFIHP
jgi:hypothetical protein